MVIQYSRGEVYEKDVQLGLRKNSNDNDDSLKDSSEDSSKDFSKDFSKESPVVTGDMCGEEAHDDSSER